jgi:AraC-like DNA-binding protein
MATKNLQRVGFLVLVPPLLRRYGVDANAVLEAVDLEPHALEDPDALIPYKTMGKLIAEAAKQTGRAAFGWEVGRQIRTKSLGLLGQAMRNSPTLRVALREFAINQHRNAHGGVVYLSEGRRHANFGYAIYEQNMPGVPLLYDGFIMAACNVIEELTSEKSPGITELHFSHAPPADLKPYQALGIPLRFNARQTAVVLPRKLLGQRVPGARADLLPPLTKAIRHTWHSGQQDFVTQLRSTLKVGLLIGEVSSSAVSASLGISHRTVSRRLRILGHGFQELLDETRCEFVQQLLENTALSIKEISTIVGYVEPSTLSRAFIRWKGVNPQTWRRSNAPKSHGKAT